MSRRCKNSIGNIDFKPIHNSDVCNDARRYSIKQLQIAVQANSATVLLPRRKRIIKPWVTQGLLRCMCNRDNLHKKSKLNSDNEELRITYTRYRNFCNSILKKVRRSYEKNWIQKVGSDNKRL